MLLTPRYDGPSVLSIDGSVSDQHVPFVRQRQRLATIVAALDVDQWSAETRCVGWTVHDVVAHLIGVNTFWSASVAAGLAGEPTRILAAFDPAATPPLMVASMRSLTPRELVDQFVASNDGLFAKLADLDDDGWTTIAESPAGHVPIRLLVSHALWDSWVHERDIAVPLGLAPVLEADETLACLRYAAGLSPALAITNANIARGTFTVRAEHPNVAFTLEVGESVVVRDGIRDADAACLRGDAVALVEALSLRAPLPSSAPAAWRKLLDGLAVVFEVETAQE